MIEEGRDCDDIVTQLLAVRTAIERIATEVISTHIDECLVRMPPDEARATIARDQHPCASGVRRVDTIVNGVKEDAMDWLTHLIKPAVPSLTPAEAHRLQRAGALLIDVREPDEWRGGHAPGAKLIPLGQLAAKFPALPRDREILFICRSGNRSARATDAAREAGLRASNVSGGMIAWAQAKLPIER